MEQINLIYYKDGRWQQWYSSTRYTKEMIIKILNDRCEGKLC